MTTTENYEIKDITKINNGHVVKVGDTVQLNSGSLPMTITSIYKSKQEFDEVCVQWCDQHGKVHAHYFRAELLTACQDPEIARINYLKAWKDVTISNDITTKNEA